MTERVIFLDMDGVLSSPRAFYAQSEREIPHRWIDPIAVRYLNMLCLASSARVVVSSVWRLGSSRPEFTALLQHHGFTGELHEDWRTIYTASSFRGDEVNEWMGRHPEVSVHLILDDESDFHAGQPLVKTDIIEGFLLRHLREAFKVICPDGEDGLHTAMNKKFGALLTGCER